MTLRTRWLRLSAATAFALAVIASAIGTEASLRQAAIATGLFLAVLSTLFPSCGACGRRLAVGAVTCPCMAAPGSPAAERLAEGSAPVRDR